MQFYEFGCAPQAVKDGFNPSVTIFHGTTEEAQIKFTGQDVAVVYGASIQGSNGFEFGVMSRTPSTKENAVSANLTSAERVAKGMTPYPSNYLVLEALRDINGDRFAVKKGELRTIRFGYGTPDFIPRVVAQARAGETIDWGGASVFTDAYRVIHDGQKPLPPSIEARLPQSIAA